MLSDSYSNLTSTSLAKIDHTSREFWQTLSTNYQRKETQNLIENQSEYLIAKREGHPHIQFLESLGFRFEEVHVPDLALVINRLERLLAQSHLSKRRASDRLRVKFALNFTNSHNQTILTHLSFGERIPPGYRWSEENEASLETDRMFFDLLKTNVFPLAGFDLVRPSMQVSSFGHDLAHLGAFTRSPDYLSAILKNVRNLSEKSARADVYANYSQKNRIFYMTEGLVIVKPDQVDFIIEDYLKLKSEQRDLSVEELVTHLKKLSDREIKHLLEGYKRDFWSYFDSLGGATSDIFSLNHFPLKQFPLTYLKNKLFTESLIEGDGGSDRITEQQLVNIAVFQRFVINLSEMSLQELISTAFKPHIEPSDSIYQLFTKGGLMNHLRNYDIYLSQPFDM